MTRFLTIVADPPWPYENREGGGFDPIAKSKVKDGSRRQRGPREMGYPPMPMDEILALRPPAAENAHLYLWTTNAFMDEAYDVARAWGFKPKTILTYGKVQPDGRPSMKTGYYFRGATEHALFCVRGSLALATTDALPTLWLWPRLPHSVKPDAFYDLVEKCSPGPYLEMFSRRARLGWETWGNEALGGMELVA